MIRPEPADNGLLLTVSVSDPTPDGTPAQARRRRSAATVVIVVGLLSALGGFGFTCVEAIPRFSPAGRLASRLRPGMPMRDVKEEAGRLGFVWLPDRGPREDGPSEREPASVHISCHQQGSKRRDSDEGRAADYVCERLKDVTSFGMFGSSYATNIIIEHGTVARWWFYMD